MTHLDLFSGIGGFALAARWMGWETVQFVEIDPFCQAVLKRNFNGVPIHGDIKTFDGKQFRGTVDIITGGFPCQPFSSSGKRQGTKDDRYLWPEMLRIIRTVKPIYIVGENVYGLVNWSKGMVFEQVQIDLETEGYQVTPVILPACAVNAPHRRDRIWFVAYSQESRVHRTSGESGGTTRRQDRKCNEQHFIDGRIRLTAHADSKHSALPVQQRRQIKASYTHACRAYERGTLTNPTRFRWLQGKYRNEPEVNYSDGQRVSWERFPTQSPVRDGNDGVPARLVRSAIEAGGNAIVPQVAFEIFKAIEATI